MFSIISIVISIISIISKYIQGIKAMKFPFEIPMRNPHPHDFPGAGAQALLRRQHRSQSLVKSLPDLGTVVNLGPPLGRSSRTIIDIDT